MDRKIVLGDHEVPAYAQRHAYITNKVGRVLQEIIEKGGDVADPTDFVPFLGDSAYDLIVAMCPGYGKVCPRYEFLGFGSREALEEREYDEEKDRGPTFPEIEQALRTLVEVNRFDALKVLARVIDPKLLRAQINLALSEFLESRAPSGGSASEHFTTDGFDPSTSSGTTPQTSTASEDSPSSGLSTSSSPAPVGVSESTGT